MQLSNKRIWIAALCVLFMLGFLLATLWQPGADGGEKSRRIAVMSSMALQWGEADIGAIARGETRQDPLVERLSELGALSFVDSIAELQAAKPDVAILLQPRALSPDELVRLDNWVRAGGRLLVFADPALQWPSDLPLGDPQRPLFTSLLSPILAHWGIELALPLDATSKDAATNFEGRSLLLASPGIWLAVREGAKATGHCAISADGYFAECRPGKGQVILVADADLLYSGHWQSQLPSIDASDNMLLVEDLVDSLELGRRVIESGGK